MRLAARARKGFASAPMCAAIELARCKFVPLASAGLLGIVVVGAAHTQSSFCRLTNPSDLEKREEEERGEKERERACEKRRKEELQLARQDLHELVSEAAGEGRLG